MKVTYHSILEGWTPISDETESVLGNLFRNYHSSDINNVLKLAKLRKHLASAIDPDSPYEATRLMLAEKYLNKPEEGAKVRTPKTPEDGDQFRKAAKELDQQEVEIPDTIALTLVDLEKIGIQWSPNEMTVLLGFIKPEEDEL